MKQYMSLFFLENKQPYRKPVHGLIPINQGINHSSTRNQGRKVDQFPTIEIGTDPTDPGSGAVLSPYEGL
jgi:hypothetical protein